MKFSALTLGIGIAFCTLTVFALALDSMYPQGFASTPDIQKQKLTGEKGNIRDRSLSGGRYRSRGFRFGK